QARVEQVIKSEEAAFAQTLDAGMQRLGGLLDKSGDVLDGEALFQLHDTFGCPPDLILDILRERGATLAEDAMTVYQRSMNEQRERARSASRFTGGSSLPGEWVARLEPTRFEGYESLASSGCRVVALMKDGAPVESLIAGDEGAVILDRTPFYAESGGQVGDAGQLYGESARFEVSDTQKVSAVFHGHFGRLLEGAIALGDTLDAQVEGECRAATVLNHSATHLLHAALRAQLGEHVQQKGSLVAPDRLRFDFSHFEPIRREQLARIEEMVNAEIRRNEQAEVHQMSMQEALDFGALALFGEKYGECVRVLRMGSFSTELCGGTHVRRTGDIGVFKIVSESGISAGVRRIEALTGQRALDHIAEQERALDQVAGLLGASRSDAADRLAQLIERQKKLERELEAFRARATAGASADLAA
ncbi:MAG: alanine--tRNA ligase-related protein, partial [Afipia sp.]|nr:alanine--tRNA ligase-related protein [Afipia sp.]